MAMPASMAAEIAVGANPIGKRIISSPGCFRKTH
jgi:hypothetical protein